MLRIDDMHAFGVIEMRDGGKHLTKSHYEKHRQSRGSGAHTAEKAVYCVARRYSKAIDIQGTFSDNNTPRSRFPSLRYSTLC